MAEVGSPIPHFAGFNFFCSEEAEAISAPPLYVMPEVGQCMFTAEVICLNQRNTYDNIWEIHMPILQYLRNTSVKIWEIQIFRSPLYVMPEVGQCLFTGKTISPRQTTICRPVPSQQQCNVPTGAEGKKRRQLFVTWIIGNTELRAIRRGTIRGRQAPVCKRMKDTGEKTKVKLKGDFPIKLSWETYFLLSSRGDESKCLWCTKFHAEHIHVGFKRRWKWGFPKISAGSRTLIPAISSFVKASTPWL